MQRARRRGNEGKTQHTLSAYRVPDQRFTCTNTHKGQRQGEFMDHLLCQVTQMKAVMYHF